MALDTWAAPDWDFSTQHRDFKLVPAHSLVEISLPSKEGVKIFFLATASRIHAAHRDFLSPVLACMRAVGVCLGDMENREKWKFRKNVADSKLLGEAEGEEEVYDEKVKVDIC